MAKQSLTFTQSGEGWETTFAATGETQTLWLNRTSTSGTDRGFRIIAALDDEQITIGEYPSDGKTDLHFTVREEPDITIRLVSECPVETAYIFVAEEEVENSEENESEQQS